MTSLAGRAHPFTSATVALGLMALTLIVPAPVGTLVMYGVTIAIALGTGLRRSVWLGALAAAPLWVLLFISQGILGEAPRVAAPWGGTLSEPGLQWTVSQGARLGAIITASLGLAAAFDAHRFLQAAIARRWPFGAAFLVVATFDAATRFGEQAKRLREAQRSRGLRVHGSLAIRVRAIPALIFPLLLASITEADDHALALETRGLTLPGVRTATDPPADSLGNHLIRWGTLAAVVFAFIWRLAR
jgi:energy-coupling factor transporter transmembrane protein EcfT